MISKKTKLTKIMTRKNRRKCKSYHDMAGNHWCLAWTVWWLCQPVHVRLHSESSCSLSEWDIPPSNHHHRSNDSDAVLQSVGRSLKLNEKRNILDGQMKIKWIVFSDLQTCWLIVHQCGWILVTHSGWKLVQLLKLIRMSQIRLEPVKVPASKATRWTMGQI